MPHRARNVLLASASVLAMALGTVALGTARPVAPAQGTRTASVNLSRVVDKLQERQDFEMQVEAMKRQFQEEAQARAKKLESGLKEVEAMPDTPERQAKAEPLILEQLQMEQWANGKMGELDYEKSLMWRSIYRNLRSEAAKLAEAEGYDYIIIDDGTDDLQTSREAKMPQEAQVLDQIQRRRVLYASPAHDLTDKLIVRMNNARAAGTSAPAPSGAK
ncbi:MAG: OmpH family outer membrane protein [Planctomycetes bacterium]|nr:OmpH family outer membrane protein [Planctomycetota bacterium]